MSTRQAVAAAKTAVTTVAPSATVTQAVQAAAVKQPVRPATDLQLAGYLSLRNRFIKSYDSNLDQLLNVQTDKVTANPIFKSIGQASMVIHKAKTILQVIQYGRRMKLIDDVRVPTASAAKPVHTLVTPAAQPAAV